MAKLHFYFSAMNAGKSTALLQSNYNYKEKAMNTLLFAPNFDNRSGKAEIHSRIGLSAPAILYNNTSDLYEITTEKNNIKIINCVFVDESQFLSKSQVYQLTEVVDRLDIPVLAYGLRTDFLANPFDGSKYLLSWADDITEIKTICHCGKKANHVLKIDENGNVAKQGFQIEIGGNDMYVSVCRLHFKDSCFL